MSWRSLVKVAQTENGHFLALSPTKKGRSELTPAFDLAISLSDYANGIGSGRSTNGNTRLGEPGSYSRLYAS